MAKKTLYRISFMSQGQVYEIYANSVEQGMLFGFIEVEELVFGERSSVVVDPSEEKIKTEFEGVKRTHLPMHSIIRIDEVDKEGVSKFQNWKAVMLLNFQRICTIPVATLNNLYIFICINPVRWILRNRMLKVCL
jgi:hypothetical protein